jgi:hypothetical protein
LCESPTRCITSSRTAKRSSCGTNGKTRRGV